MELTLILKNIQKNSQIQMTCLQLVQYPWMMEVSELFIEGPLMLRDDL